MAGQSARITYRREDRVEERGLQVSSLRLLFPDELKNHTPAVDICHTLVDPVPDTRALPFPLYEERHDPAATDEWIDRAHERVLAEVRQESLPLAGANGRPPAFAGTERSWKTLTTRMARQLFADYMAVQRHLEEQECRPGGTAATAEAIAEDQAKQRAIETQLASLRYIVERTKRTGKPKLVGQHQPRP